MPAGPDPLCAGVPVGFWRFDDCNTERTELGDSSFESHTAFRTVDLTCRPGQEGLAASFVNADDLVYVPDQPSFALDNGVTVAAWVRPDSVDRVGTIFRKRDDATSAFALVVNGRRFQFVLRLASGRNVTVSAPAIAGRWTHVAATYDGAYARLYIGGKEVAHTAAKGVIARGVGPILIGNDGSHRRFQGRIDNAWFNTQAAPGQTIAELTCLRADPTLTVSPEVGPAVAAGTSVNYTLSITSQNDPVCAPESFFASVFAQQSDFIIEPSFVDIPQLASGESRTLQFAAQSGVDTEAGSYPISFQVFSQGPFGGPIFGPGPIFRGSSGVAVATPTAAIGTLVGVPTAPPPPAEMEEPTRPAPTGFVTVTAQYVVAEPTGCHVSPSRELMIRNLSVVEDPIRTSFAGPADDARTGAWSFGRLMERLSPTAADAPDVTEAMFRTFLSPQTVNGFTIPVRTPMDQIVLQPWPRTADGKLDLARAPMRLLAIAHRLDLNDIPKGKGGEGRFVFGVLDSFGNQMEFTVILEYNLPAANDDEFRGWVDQIHALQDLPFPSEEYNVALQAVTDRFTGRGAMPDQPNGSGIIDIRTNEIALSLDGQWQLREFRLAAEGGFMTPFPIFQTPDSSFNFTPALGRFINENESIILTERHEVPLLFEGVSFQGASVFNNIDFWDAPGITNPEARHKFSLNTCNGCHGAETQTGFLQVFPRSPGFESSLSGFLTGITVFDPVTGQERRLRELGRRRELLESIVCADEP